MAFYLPITNIPMMKQTIHLILLYMNYNNKLTAKISAMCLTGHKFKCDSTFYYIDNSVLVENRPLIKFIQNYIRDSSGVFSMSSLVRISMTSLLALTLLFVQKYSCPRNKKKITRWLEDMNFIFSW